ncbi:hypothetical protein CTAYLR_004092 [Chrysophaeum taylorii]|uniref:ornithine decarboxylase n=1 Tax=Chrysophaeum taylorii TaxID=2483200 RepID=A0AAD7XLD8_9STRA|nr:hypothetical protein CTAYLR_004092 [Chrysophaeum taylorii]
MTGVQEDAWQRREARMRRIVAAWEERAAKVVAAAAPARVERGGAWRATRSKAVSLANGRKGVREFAAQQPGELFWVVDLGCVEKLFAHWVRSLPRVRPHYAVKCFPDARVLEVLRELGCGFDCASAGEVEMVGGAAPIIFANPCKRPEDLECISKHKIALATFDSVSEINKLKKWCPDCSGVLRLRADDPDSRLPFGVKYGALLSEVPGLKAAADRCGVKIAGVSFHVGSGARTARAYRAAIEAARTIMTPDMTVLDLGGGFCGDFDKEGNPRLSAAGDVDLVRVINSALDDFFPQLDWPHLDIIAEPGRYFAESVATLCARVIGERRRGRHNEYWISDGVYGAFNALIYDAWLPHAIVEPHRPPADPNTTTTVFGPTCDSLDVLFYRVHPAPEIRMGDLLLFPNSGAYTLAGATDKFNGIPATPRAGIPVFYVRSDSMRDTSSSSSSSSSSEGELLYSDKPPMELIRYFLD